MGRSFLKQTAEILRTKQRRKHLKRAMVSLSVIVAMLTSYLLILPAVTMERDPICGQEEHTHTDECYEHRLICGKTEQDGQAETTQRVLSCAFTTHQHTENCYNADGQLVCGYADYAIHTHDENCYDADGNLVCTLPEVKQHGHDGSCYATETVLACGQDESSVQTIEESSDPFGDGTDVFGSGDNNVYVGDSEGGHTHTEECYETKYTLVCGMNEVIPHTHTAECYDENGNLVCGRLEIREHRHDENCFMTVTTEAVEGHTHTDECYEDVLICDVAEHVHTEECYPQEEAEDEVAEGEVAEAADADENADEAVAEETGEEVAGEEAAAEEDAQEDVDTVEDAEAADETAEEDADTAEETEGAEEEDSDLVAMEPAVEYICGKEEHTHGEECWDEEGNLICGMEEHVHDETCLPEADEEEAAEEPVVEKILTAEGSDYTVEVTYTDEAQIPDDAVLSVREIEQGTEEYESYYQQAVEAVQGGDTSTLAFARFFDISFVVDGTEIEPAAAVAVKISYKDAVEVPEGSEVKSVHFGEETEVLDVQTNGADGTVEEVEFDANGFSVYGIVGTETLTTQVITAKGETYTIEVTYGPEAGIPSGARLEAREILEGTEEYQKYLEQAKDTVTKASESAVDEKFVVPEGEDPKKADDGEGTIDSDEPITAARFFDINIYVGEEKIEPKAPVQVNIKYNDAIQLKENEFLKAIHFASEGTDLISVDVMESKEGITEVTFEQDSFSVTGTVVRYLSSGWPDNGDYVMIVKPYNSNNYYAVKNDGEITSVNYNANTGKVTFSDLTSVNQVDDYWWTKSNSNSSNWKYLRAKNSPQNYLDPNEANALATSSGSVHRTANGNVYNQTYFRYNYLLVNETSLQIEGQGSSDSANRAVIFFANDFEVDEVPEPIEKPIEVDLGAPGTGKTIKSNNDGTYQLALSVTGKSQAQDKKSTADILVVFDTSGSMDTKRMSTAVSAMKGLANTLFSNNTADNPDTVRMKLLTFSTVTRFKTNNDNPQYYIDFAWVTGTNGATTFSTQLEKLASEGNGGTNWEDALQDALSVEMREDAAKYVIFVSDGNPTYRNTRGGEYNNWGTWQDWKDENSSRRKVFGVWGTGTDENSTTVSHCYDMARDDAKALVDAGMNFYTIGVYGNVDRMNNLTAFAYSGSDSGSYPTGHYQTATDQTSLNNAFAAIIADIQKNYSYTDVEIDDGITALTATALVTGTVNNYEYKISYVDAVDNQIHTVNVTKNADGTLSIPNVTYNIKDADGTTKSVTTTSVIIKGASYDGSAVKWELDKSDGSNYKLENGWTYEVSFTVWPTQRAYDLIADLANGNVTYASLTEDEKKSIDQATLTLKTNSEASVTYRQITTTNGVDGTPSDPNTVDITNPPGIPLMGSDLKIVKRWNDDLDPTQLLDLLTDHLNDAGTDVDYTVTLDVVQDKGTSEEEHVHTAEYPNGFVFKPNVTIADGEVTAATWPEIDIAVAPGIMMSAENAKKHGFDTAVDSEGNPKYKTIEFGGVTYYIIEKGHRYEITERSVDYHFEMMTDIDHLMIIDGVLKNVIHNDDGSIKEISQNSGNLTELGATNSLKGGINLYKYVEDSDGNKITPKDDVFTVKCKLVDEAGNAYTRSSGTVGDDESDGIVYRVYAPDSELATVYPGKVDTGKNRTIKIGVLDSSEFTVQLKAGWSIRFINVPSNTIWEFEEVNIPTGYKIDTTGKEVVDGLSLPKTRGMTGIAMTNTANDAQITNIMEDFETRILKIETSTGKKNPETGEYTTEPVKLDGVKFIVKNNDEGGDNGKYLVLTDGEISWSSNRSDAHEFTTANGGVASFGSLPLGKYLLTETETKAGYNLLTEDISIEVTADGVNYQINSTSQPQKATKKTVIEDGKTIIYSQIEVPNSPGVELPHTGGSGTLPYTLGGLMLTITALMYGFVSRRRRERRLR